MTVGSVFVFLSVRWLVFERVMSYRLILYFYPHCRISETCFPVYWLYKYLHTACISNAMGNIRNTGYWIGYRIQKDKKNLRFPPSSLLVFSTQHSSCHKDSWDTEGPSPSPCLLFSGKSDHPICYFAAKKAWPLNCECWEKLFSATEVRFPPAWRQQTAHCHIVTTAAQPPAEPQFISSPKLFFFFFIPPAPLPWADFIPTAIAIFPNRVLEWGEGKKIRNVFVPSKYKVWCWKKKNVLSSDKSWLSQIFCGTFTLIW